MYRKPEVKSMGTATELILGVDGPYSELQFSACIDPTDPNFDSNVDRDAQGQPLSC